MMAPIKLYRCHVCGVVLTDAEFDATCARGAGYCYCQFKDGNRILSDYDIYVLTSEKMKTKEGVKLASEIPLGKCDFRLYVDPIQGYYCRIKDKYIPKLLCEKCLKETLGIKRRTQGIDSVIFEEDICDAKMSGTQDVLEVSCSKGKMSVEGDIKKQFWAYHNWCSGCNRKHIIKRQELVKVAKSFATNVAKQFDKDHVKKESKRFAGT